MLLFLLELLRGLFFVGYVKSASFPKPLTPPEERQAVAELLEGAEGARDRLILSAPISRASTPPGGSCRDGGSWTTSSPLAPSASSRRWTPSRRTRGACPGTPPDASRTRSA